ncbi:MAG: SDR family oxidoreductase [Psychroflexus sp.]|nr:SDR family oxidoreductase [Psychroflexus sp.]
MKILLTGATGYIGKRILPILIGKGHHVVCCVRDPDRFNPPQSIRENVSVIQADLLDKDSLGAIPKDIDAAYYLVHSMATSADYQKMEEDCATNFRDAVEKTSVKQVIYLSGIVNENNLSKHLASRLNVENKLSEGSYHFTSLRAGIIIGSGSASFEIIRDLVEKLPVMIAPKWLSTRCQPVGISDVLVFLTKTLMKKETFNQSFDIGGPDILTYKEMLLGYSDARELDRKIYTIPVMTARLSSYWLYFVSSTTYKLASSLVDSMKVEVVCANDDINHILDVQPISYHEALRKAFQKIENNDVLSSWKDASVSSDFHINPSDFIQVPDFGCFKDKRRKTYIDREVCLDKVWSIGGETGWYYATFLWKIRGVIDKFYGGVGLRRGRTNLYRIDVGDSLDFWRVLYANREEGRLLLYAEMKLPGEAWLEFKLQDGALIQSATFRPTGLLGRLYWYSVLPFHVFIFQGLINKLTSENL